MPRLKIYIAVGEPSGDALGASLMSALQSESPDTNFEFCGLAGEKMQALGTKSLFPISELAIMSPTEILARLPGLWKLVKMTVDDAVAARPDCLVIIDSPEFTQSVAKRVHKKAPEIPIVNYVSPSVWAWRPGRAKRMARYIDRVLALLPFEVDAHKRLGGPPCTYIGHPLAARMEDFAPDRAAREDFEINPRLLVLPGSRTSEVNRLSGVFGEAIGQLAKRVPNLSIELPVVAHLKSLVEAKIAEWPVKPIIVEGEVAKLAAFRSATAALAASGTVTLELALARVPMVAGYRVDWIANSFKWLMVAEAILLPNLIAGRKFVPELIQQDCVPDRIVSELLPLLSNSEARRQQMAGFEDVAKNIDVGGADPARLAAREVLDVINTARRNSISAN